MRCTAGLHEGSATVTLDRWQGPWNKLPNEFVASASNAASNCPIQHLILKQHRLDSLPLNFASPETQLPTFLVTLDLSFNIFKSLPSVVCQLVQLNNLHLNNNQITQLPDELSNLKQLRVLHLQHNKLEALPVCCCYLESLHTLNVKDNLIKTVPEEIHHLNNLREVDAGSNQIESLPCTFAQLPKLEEAHLTDNQLKSLPCHLEGLKSLKQLYLANNKLRFLPLSFIKLKLEGFTISGNNLKFPPLSACRNGVKNLQAYMFREYCNSSVEFQMHTAQGMVDICISDNLYYDDSSDSGEETPYEDLDN